MKPTTTFDWMRGEHLDIRSPQSADRLAIEALQHDRSLPDSHSLAGLCSPINKSPPDRLVVEVDQQIVGSLTLRLGRAGLRLPRHPWSLLATRATDPDGQEGGSGTLLVVGLRRTAHQADRNWRTRLGGSLPGLVQRFGARRLLLAVRPAPRHDLDPGPFLQQLTFRQTSAPRLTPLLERGFELRGWRRESSPETAPGWHALLCWENPRRG